MRTALAVVLAFIFGAAATAQVTTTAEFGMSASFDKGLYSDGTGSEAIPGVDHAKFFSLSPWASLDADSKYFQVIGKLSANTDGKYGAALVDIPGGQVLGAYFLMDEGGVRARYKSLTLSAGRFPHFDIVDSPYSLFVNGRGLTAPLLMSIAYDDGFFFYESRWILLNSQSNQDTQAWPSGFPDRGAEYKTYGFRVGDMRFGLQDAAVYAGESFDAEYFLDPLPMYFSQYFRGTGGSPWSDSRADNSIVGFFWDWKRPDGLSFLAQVLVDDIGLHWLIPSWPDNPNKLAFGVGAKMDTAIGDFGLYAAGATEYTFEGNQMTGATYADQQSAQQRLCYSYTYFPDTRFDYGRDYPSGELSEISIEDNLVGYVNGENNLAFRLVWKGSLAGFDLGSYLDFLLAGENSPTNAYHDGTQASVGGTHWLDGPVLEKRILLDVSGSRKFGDWRVFADILGGVAVDALQLEYPTPNPALLSLANNYSMLFTPVAGLVQPLLKITVGASYSLRIR